jgi:hypothetical protein
LASCRSDEDSEIPANFEGYSYLPLELGQERVYRIDSISYDDFTGTIDTTIFYERQLIVATQEDLSGRTNYRTEIYRRSADTLAWRLRSTELRYRGTYRYELNQGGNVYLPLIFPPLADSRWNTNALNAQEEIIYQYQNLHQSFQIDDNSYDSTITVLQNEEFNLISTEKDIEVYARGVGMIYRENIDLNTDINTGEITSGSERFQRLIQP